MSSFSPEDLAAAFLAKAAASELHIIDHHTTQQSSGGPANRLSPLSFINNSKIEQGNRVMSDEAQRSLIERINREAEMQCPLPAEPVYIPPSVPQVTSGFAASTEATENVLSVLSDIRDILTVISTHLTSNNK